MTPTRKRGYSRDFTPRTERRIKIEIDRVPPGLNDAVKARARREGISVRALVLTLLKAWAERPEGTETETAVAVAVAKQQRHTGLAPELRELLKRYEQKEGTR